MSLFVKEFYERFVEGNSTLKVHFSGHTYTSTDIQHALYSWASLFHEQGITAKTRVALAVPNNPHYLFSLYGLLSLGAIPVIIDYSLDSEVFLQLVEEEPYVLTDREEAYSAHTTVIPLHLMNNHHEVSPDIVNVIRTALATPVHASDTVLVLPSSGTTGLPKKVRYGDQNILWAMREYHRVYRFDEYNCIACPISFHYSLVFITCALAAMLYQKDIVIFDPSSIEGILQGIEEYHVQIFPAIPLLYKKMAKMDLSAYNLSSLHICDSGGEIIPLAIIEKLQKNIGLAITEGYGLTETTSLSHFLLPDSTGTLRLGSVGQPCTDVQCRLVGKTGQNVLPYEPGELWVRGPLLMQGYDNEDLTKDVMTSDGWLKTGDLFYTDEDNFYFFVFRKSLISASGITDPRILRELEQSLYAVEEISEATFVISNDGKTHLFISTQKQAPADLAILQTTLLEMLTNLSLTLGGIHFVQHLPRTTSGKIKRNRIATC